MMDHNNQGRGGAMAGFNSDTSKERREAIARLRDHAKKPNLEFPVVAGCLREVATDLERFVTEFVKNGT